MESNFLSPQPSSVTNILTLRYDTSITPNLPRKTSKDIKLSHEEPSMEFIEKAIVSAIRKKLDVSSVNKACIALSGGIDSTLILTLIKKTIPDLQVDAISIKFADSIDETENASKIAAELDTNHHIVYVDNYLRELPKAISIIKLPFWDLHWYHVVKKSQSMSKYLASGDGGDELFGGYTFRYKKFLSLTSENSSPLEKVKAYLECHERDRVPDQENIFSKKCNFSWNKIYEKFLSYFDNNLSRINQVYLADYNGKLLYNFNPINTRIIQHFDMDLLTPILNDELLSSAPHIPTEKKYDEKNNIGKLPLRKLLEQNNVSSLVSTEKLGFNVNTQNLWKEYGHDLCKEYFDKSRLVEDGLINNNWILKHIDNPEINIKYVNKFLGLLSCEIWYRLFITKEMNSNTTLD